MTESNLDRNMLRIRDAVANSDWADMGHVSPTSIHQGYFFFDEALAAHEEKVRKQHAGFLSGHGWSLMSPSEMAAHDAEVAQAAAANALREFAMHLDGGTPRAWGFHHPCDPAGVRWEPSADDRVTMLAADGAREIADRIERRASGYATV